MSIKSSWFALPGIIAALLAAGCGSSSTSTGASGVGGGAGTSSSSSAGSGGALAADAASATTGDIPDSQNYLTFHDATLRFSMPYPEGWVVQQSKRGVTFRDKNNLVRIEISSDPVPTPATVQAQMATLKSADPSLTSGSVSSVGLKNGQALKVTYKNQSAPNPVTGKRVTLNVNRYEIPHAGKVAIVDLGTPTGVDNKNAYDMMIGSFKWG